jgi:hypothetical protein
MKVGWGRSNVYTERFFEIEGVKIGVEGGHVFHLMIMSFTYF